MAPELDSAPLRPGDGRDLLEVLDPVGVGHHPVHRRELGERHRAEGGLPGEQLGDHVEHVVVGGGSGLRGEVVHAEEVVGPRPVGARHPQEPALELLTETRPRLLQRLVVVQGLPGGGEPEAVGVEHGPDEERPVGQHVGHRVTHQHPLRVEPVRPPGGRGVRQHEGEPPNPRGRVREVDDVQRGEAEHSLAPPGGGGAARGPLAVLPGEGAPGDRHRAVRRLDREVDPQVGRGRRGQPLDHGGGQQLGRTAPRADGDVGAGLGARLGSGRHLVRAVVASHPEPGQVAAGAAGGHPDLVGDEEAGQQADAELTEEALAGQAEGIALGRRSDRREHATDAVLIQPDPGVLDVQAAVGRDVCRHDPHPSRCGGFLLRAGGDGVDGVLQQLAQVHPGAGVQVVREQVDHAAEVDVEGRRGPRHALIQTDGEGGVDLSRRSGS